MADTVSIRPTNIPYTNHAAPFATVREKDAFTEVRTYDDGILITRHDERTPGRSSTCILPWDVVLAAAQHHPFAAGLLAAQTEQKEARKASAARAKATRASRQMAKEADDRVGPHGATERDLEA